jgi:hypothetical protein
MGLECGVCAYILRETCLLSLLRCAMYTRLDSRNCILCIYLIYLSSVVIILYLPFDAAPQSLCPHV